MVAPLRARRRSQWAAALLVVSGVGFGPAWHDSARSVHRAATAAPAGVYVLARATGTRPPIPFVLQAPGGPVSGTIEGARVTLAADSTYTVEVVVRCVKAPALPFPVPGLEPGKEPRVVRGAGRYTVQGNKIVLEPGDLIARGLVRSVEARAAEKALTLTGATAGIGGQHFSLDAEFTKTFRGRSA